MPLDIEGGSDIVAAGDGGTMRIPTTASRAIAFNVKGQQITYSVLSSPAPNLKTGAITQTTTDTVISKALVGSATDQDIAESQGRYKQGDRVFRVRSTDLPARPNRAARITFGSKTYNVIGYRTNQNDEVYDLFCREP